MRNNILQIALDSKHSKFLSGSIHYVQKFGNQTDCGHLESVVLNKACDSDWQILRPQTRKEKWLKEGIILTVEYLLNLPIGFFLDSEKKNFNEYLYSQYNNRIVADADGEDDNNLHLIIHVSTSDKKTLTGVDYIIKSIPENLKEHFKVHIIAYGNDLLGGSVATTPEDRLNTLNHLQSMIRNNNLGRMIYVSNYDESGRCLNFDKESNLSAYVGQLLIHFINDYRSLSVSPSQGQNVGCLGIESISIDRCEIVNEIFHRTLGGILKSFIGDVNNSERVDNLFSNFVTSNNDIINNEIQSDSFNERGLSDKIVQQVNDILSSKELSLSEKLDIIQRLRRVWNQDISSLINSFQGKTFEDIYMPLLEELGLETPYPEVKQLINEIKSHKQNIIKQQTKLKELKKHLPPTQQNCYWIEGGFKVGEEIYKTIPNNSITDDKSFSIEEYQPNGQSLNKSADIRNGFGEIKSQGNQGACVSFSLVSIIEYYLNNAIDNKDLSEAFVYYTAREISNSTDIDNGVAIEHALQSLQSKGVCIEALCPYNDKIYDEKPSDQAYSDAITRKIEKALHINNNVDDIKSAISEGNPIVASFRVFKSLERNTDGFVHMPSDEELLEEEQYHAMVICGYNDDNKYVIVRNSWGKKFGNNGYCYIPYSYLRNPDLTRSLYIVKMPKVFTRTLPVSNDIDKIENYSPQFNYEINNNRIAEEEYRLKEETELLGNKIIVLRNILSNIVSNTNIDDFTSSLEEEVKNLEQQLIQNDTEFAQIDTKFVKIRKYVPWISFACIIASIIVGVFLTRKDHINVITSICFAVSGCLGLIIWYLKSKKYRSTKECRNEIQSKIESLRSDIGKKKKMYSIFQAILLEISKADDQIRVLDNSFEELISLFINWYQLLGGNNASDNSIDCGNPNELELLSKIIFDNNTDKTIKEKFVQYQERLIQRLFSEFSIDIDDVYCNKVKWLKFIELIANKKIPVELTGQSRNDKITLICNIETESLDELKSKAHNVIKYENSMLLIGLMEKTVEIGKISTMTI